MNNTDLNEKHGKSRKAMRNLSKREETDFKGRISRKFAQKSNSGRLTASADKEDGCQKKILQARAEKQSDPDENIFPERRLRPTDTWV